MKNIKEAAKRCGNELIPRDIGVEPHTGEKYDRNEFARTRFMQGYKYGANAVLEEMEKLLDEFSNLEDSLIVIRAIDQLKK